MSRETLEAMVALLGDLTPWKLAKSWRWWIIVIPTAIALAIFQGEPTFLGVLAWGTLTGFAWAYWTVKAAQRGEP